MNARAALRPRRAPRPFAWHLELEPRGESATEPGRWVEAPPAPPGSWTFAAPDLSPSWRGRLDRWLLGLPPLELEAVDDRGRQRTVRILPDTAAGGLLVAPSASAISSLDELAALWSASAPNGLPRIVRFRLAGPGGCATSPGSASAGSPAGGGRPPDLHAVAEAGPDSY
jgi:hypothetical protein